MTEQEEIVRAERARQIMEDPLVKGALTDIKTAVVEQWLRAPVKDSELREYLWAIYVGTSKFEEILKSHMETGVLAAEQLRTKEARKAQKFMA